ncbi:MAG: UDP-N-acetylglucosamine 2-epimerase (non-hydrolyzing) [Gammaproteobacteria bacterium]|nr:UDP-N-acetylglucosamine 2-epimerase (non-hydrolyzing) [Gammaproteobacteria bacterium]
MTLLTEPIKKPDKKVEQLLVHTGQHYDKEMSALFFDELGLPEPDINLQIGSGPHGQQTGRIMEEFEKILLQEKPDVVLVVGDVNSTMACAIDAKKLGIPVVHVEAGLRSFDMSMPEEINRLLTDCIADMLFTTDKIADTNLAREGVNEDKIHFVGNVMIDSLLKHKDKAMQNPVLRNLNLLDSKDVIQKYAVVTLHRPNNVEDPAVLNEIGHALSYLGNKIPVIFPVHPRTRQRFEQYKLDELFSEKNGIQLHRPFGYLEFLKLMAESALIITDSGGIQEESTILGIPCLTIRPNTERPITITEGTNRLVGHSSDEIIQAIKDVESGMSNKGSAPNLWDGNSADRIAAIIIDKYQS